MECNRNSNCFHCIREETEYEFTYECEIDCLRSLCNNNTFRSDEDLKYFNSLVETCFYTALELQSNYLISNKDKNANEHWKSRAEVLGDSIARLYLFDMLRMRTITRDKLLSVQLVIRQAAFKSMPAWGVLDIIDNCNNLNRKFPKCWMRKYAN